MLSPTFKLFYSSKLFFKSTAKNYELEFSLEIVKYFSLFKKVSFLVISATP